MYWGLDKIHKLKQLWSLKQQLAFFSLHKPHIVSSVNFVFNLGVKNVWASQMAQQIKNAPVI